MNAGPHRRLRADVRFVAVFSVILILGFSVAAIRPVDEALIRPFTGAVAYASAAILAVLGEDVSVTGNVLRSPRFAVAIHNGCNGLVTSLVLVAGVLAFPASWRARLLGTALGLVAIQGINLTRVVSLYYTGVFLPGFFNEAHVAVWQSVVVLSGIVLWLVWARWAVARGHLRR